MKKCVGDHFGLGLSQIYSLLTKICAKNDFLVYRSLFSFSSLLWYCWLGLLTCKNRLPYNLYCVGGDVKHCPIQSNIVHFLVTLTFDL